MLLEGLSQNLKGEVEGVVWASKLVEMNVASGRVESAFLCNVLSCISYGKTRPMYTVSIQLKYVH